MQRVRSMNGCCNRARSVPRSRAPLRSDRVRDALANSCRRATTPSRASVSASAMTTSKIHDTEHHVLDDRSRGRARCGRNNRPGRARSIERRFARQKPPTTSAGYTEPSGAIQAGNVVLRATRAVDVSCERIGCSLAAALAHLGIVECAGNQRCQHPNPLDPRRRDGRTHGAILYRVSSPTKGERPC